MGARFGYFNAVLFERDLYLRLARFGWIFKCVGGVYFSPKAACHC